MRRGRMLRNKLTFRIISMVFILIVIGLSIWGVFTKQYTNYTYLFLGLMMISTGIFIFQDQRKTLAYMYWVTGIIILISFIVSI